MQDKDNTVFTKPVVETTSSQESADQLVSNFSTNSRQVQIWWIIAENTENCSQEYSVYSFCMSSSLGMVLLKRRHLETYIHSQAFLMSYLSITLISIKVMCCKNLNTIYDNFRKDHPGSKQRTRRQTQLLTI